MPPDPPHHTAARRLAVAGALLAALPLAACGAPPVGGAAAPATSPGVGGPPTRGVLPSGVPTAVPPATATPGFPPAVALTPTPFTPPGPTPVAVTTACAGRPSADRVVGLLRGRVLPADVRVRATTGPLCADGWQYTVLAVTGHEELQVVTRGEPGALRLVTAGTDVCSIEVRAAAPPAIRTLACDAGPGSLPGA